MATVAVTASLALSLTGNVTPTSQDVFGNLQKALAFVKQLDITAGTSANQADVYYAASLTPGTGGQTIDLSGSLVDPFGNTITPVEIMAMVFYNRSTTTAEIVTIGNAASNQFADWLGGATNTIKLGPGGLFVLTDPLTGLSCAGGSKDQLKLVSASGNPTVDVVLIGRSA